MRRTRLFVAALATLLVAALALAACGADEHEFHGLQRDDPLEVGGYSLPEVTTGGAAAPFAFKAAPGTLLAVYFGYTTCPDLCPTTMTDLKQAKEDLGEEGSKLRVAMTTVDPDRDSATVLSNYLSSFFPAGQYHALRADDPGSLSTVMDGFLAKATVAPHRPGDTDYEVSHSGTTYVIDENGTVVLEWPFGVKGEAMADDLRALFADLPSR